MHRSGFARQETGQSIVLVALMFAVLMASGAMALDIGRFYSERRFIQGAVDASALACAIKYSQTGDVAQAWSAGDAVLRQRNLNKNPLGIGVIYAARGSETYDQNIVSDQNLNSGILPVHVQGTGCRVAITVDVPTYLIKVVSPSLNTISMTTRAYAKAKGGFLPSVVKRYLNTGDADDNPTDDGSNEFVDTTAAEGFDSACHAGSNYAPSCIPASTSTPGREIVLFGASQPATNDSSFRGYIGLDVRNFSDANPPNSNNLLHDSYNGVAPDASINTLKDFEGAWIGEGYPGPDICVVQSANFDKCAQLAVINGSSSGIFVDWYNQFFRPGDIGMFQLYDGTVKTVPDFTMSPPSLSIPNNGTIPAKTVPYTMSSQFAASQSAICTQIIPDDGTVTSGPGDTTGRNPFLNGHITLAGGASCAGSGVGNFSSNPTPSYVSTYNQTWQNMTASNVSADQGIYQVFLRGTASAPYASRVHDYVVDVVVSSQAREFYVDTSDSTLSSTLTGLPATISWNITVRVDKGGQTRWTAGQDGDVTVRWESCPRSDDASPIVLTCYIDTLGNTSRTITPTNTVAVTALTAGASSQHSYTGWIRALGTDRNGHPVNKLWKVRLDVDQSGTGSTTEYVDVVGYAAYRITRLDSNDVYGRAVTAAYLDPNDPALAIGKKIYLVPWETP